MRRLLLSSIVVSIVFLGCAIGFLLWGNAGHEEVAVQQEATSTPLTVATATISEETPDYVIDAKYPRFGVTAIDSAIQTRIVKGVADLKAQTSEDQPAKNGFPQYGYYATFANVYVDDRFVSVRMTTEIYTGGAHGLPTIFGANFDRMSGRELTLDDALTLTGKTLAEIATEAKKQLTAQLGDDIIDAAGSDADPKNYAAFYLTKDSVIFVFQPYQVAPYAAGAPEIIIPRVPPSTSR